MDKTDNLHEYLTDIADAIREVKGTTEPINAQDFSDEIRGMSTSQWTGHVDVDGLRSIGWGDEDIAYYQRYGVNWMEEDDEYYKVSEDNKALYGVLTADNIQEYKDRIVWLPKIDIGKRTSISHMFQNCMLMKGIPFLDFTTVSNFNYAFNNCVSLTTIPLVDYSNATEFENTYDGCESLLFLPTLDIPKITSLRRTFALCKSLKKLPKIKRIGSSVNLNNMCNSCYSIEELDKEWVAVIKSAHNIDYAFYLCYTLKKITSPLVFADRNPEYSFNTSIINNVVIEDASYTNLATTFNSCHCLSDIIINYLNSNIKLNAMGFSKQSLIYMIEYEAATSAITITLSEVAYARLSTDPDIVTALSNHPLVTLASA